LQQINFKNHANSGEEKGKENETTFPVMVAKLML
jgi:hypothetical protein